MINIYQCVSLILY